ncbi:MAG: hypothetical protein IJ003_02580 [Candidatus Gastranaerophilales bacterium]|nr:hypothetical protein [Candidatus Gastranaerophilales bacterium]
MKFLKAFSLVEVLISLIIVSVIITAFAPSMTKKHQKKAIAQNSIKTDCGAINAFCTLCKGNTCYHCKIDCGINQYKDTVNCKCVDCSEGCLECGAGGVCQRCDVGYKKSGNNCVACTMSANSATATGGTYQDAPGQTTCKSCDEGHSCTTKEKILCGLGYGSNAGNSYCHPCNSQKTNCIECKSTSACTKCISTHYVSSGSCVECTAEYWCNGVSRTKCSGGTTSLAGSTSCTACNILIPYCTACSSPTSCTACESGYTLTNGKCKKNVPTTCPAGQYKQTDGACKQCEIGTYCPDGKDMYSCSSGYSSDAGATVCSKCNTRLENCEKCSSLNCCTSCNSVSYLNGCNCDACSNIANCSVCSSSSTCTRCNSGYYKNGTGCTICPAGYYCDGISKTACSIGTYQPNTGQTSCIACANAETVAMTTCPECPSGQYKSGTSCLSCTKFGKYCTKCDATNGCSKSGCDVTDDKYTIVYGIATVTNSNATAGKWSCDYCPSYWKQCGKCGANGENGAYECDDCWETNGWYKCTGNRGCKQGGCS